MSYSLPRLAFFALPIPPAIAQFCQNELLRTEAILHIVLENDLVWLEFATLAMRLNAFGIVGAFRKTDFDAEIGAVWVFERVDGAYGAYGVLRRKGLSELFTQLSVDETGRLRGG